jgi:N-terminal domain of (some) glycogen debranching enzymes
VPVQISVGPPVLTINQGNTFLVTDQNGEIRPDSEQGMFWNDTRFVSRYQVTANGQSWTRLSSSPMTYYSSRVYLTNQSLPTEEGEIPAGTLALTMSRAVEDGIHEDLDVANHNLFAVRFNLEILFHSDFADLFEVKAHEFVHRGRIDADYDRERTELRVVYSNRDFKRTVLYHILQPPPMPAPLPGPRRPSISSSARGKNERPSWRAPTKTWPARFVSRSRTWGRCGSGTTISLPTSGCPPRGFRGSSRSLAGTA